MKLYDLFQLVLRNLVRLRFQAAFSTIGVIIGTTAVIVLIALGMGLYQSAIQSISSSTSSMNAITVLPGAALRAFTGMGSASASAGDVINNDFIDEMKRRQDVLAVTPRISVNPQSITLNQWGMFGTVVGVDPSSLRGLGWMTQKGVLSLGLNSGLLGAKTMESFIDRRNQSRVNPEIGKLVGRTLILTFIRINQQGKEEKRIVRVRIVGVLSELGGQDDYTLFLPLGLVESLEEWAQDRHIDHSREGYSQASIVANSSENSMRIEAELLERGFYTISARTTIQMFNLLFLMIQAVLGGVGAIALLIAGVGIANTLTMAIYERTREIGLMKALGATNRDVMFIFLGEAGLIGFFGGVGGVLIGSLLSGIANLAYNLYLQSRGTSVSALGEVSIAYIPLWLPIGTILFATIVGVFSGLYPAQRAARMEPTAALKFE